MRSRTGMLIWLVAIFSLVSAGQAGRGAAELYLDRAAVRELLQASLPAPLEIRVPGAGAVTLRVGPVSRVRFVDGSVEAAVAVSIAELAWDGTLDARFVPGVEPLHGAVQLVPESVVLDSVLPARIDVTELVEPANLPRRLDWDLDLDDRSLRVACYVQGLEVLDDRLRVELGLTMDGPSGGK